MKEFLFAFFNLTLQNQACSLSNHGLSQQLVSWAWIFEDNFNRHIDLQNTYLVFIPSEEIQLVSLPKNCETKKVINDFNFMIAVDFEFSASKEWPKNVCT